MRGRLARWQRALLVAAVLGTAWVGVSPGQRAQLASSLVRLWRWRPGADPAATQRLRQQGAFLLARGSGTALLAAQARFESALTLDRRDAEALAGLAETQAAMAAALVDAADDVRRDARGLRKKAEARAAAEVAAMRAEALTWQQRAVVTAQGAVGLDPDAFAARRGMAAALCQMRDVDGCGDWLRRAEARAGGTGKDATLSLIEANLLAARDRSAAVALLQAACTREPANHRIRYRLAQLALQVHRPELARAAVTTILAAAPEHELAQNMAARLQASDRGHGSSRRPRGLSFLRAHGGHAASRPFEGEATGGKPMRPPAPRAASDFPPPSAPEGTASPGEASTDEPLDATSAAPPDAPANDVPLGDAPRPDAQAPGLPSPADPLPDDPPSDGPPSDGPSPVDGGPVH